MKGKYIALEGIDGSGTTTATLKIVQFLKNQNKSVVQTCEPSHGPIGLLIRSILIGKTHVSNDSLANLFLADRLDHMTKIKLWLEEGKIIISDRCYWSSLVYQQEDTSLEYLDLIHKHKALIQPDLVILLSISTIDTFERLKKRESHDMFDNVEIQKRISNRYHEIHIKSEIARNAKHVIIIPVNNLMTIEITLLTCMSFINNLLQKE